jgi:hypothetical protein
VLLDEIKQALQDALLRPANKELRRQPPRTQFGRDTAQGRRMKVIPARLWAARKTRGYSDISALRIPGEVGRRFRDEVGH